MLQQQMFTDNKWLDNKYIYVSTCLAALSNKTKAISCFARNKTIAMAMYAFWASVDGRSVPFNAHHAASFHHIFMLSRQKSPVDLENPPAPVLMLIDRPRIVLLDSYP